jgi:quercetin dioxygenase-like cupin family protein
VTAASLCSTDLFTNAIGESNGVRRASLGLSMKAFYIALVLDVSAFLCAAQSSNQQPKIENISDMKFAAFRNVPTCFTVAVEHGDPSSGPSTVLLKGRKGCEVPMHYHTATEQVVMVSGTARMEMKGDQPRIITAGAFATIPTRHPYSFSCKTNCSFYVISDGVFDSHYVDDSGNEIPFEKAAKPAANNAGSHY